MHDLLTFYYTWYSTHGSTALSTDQTKMAVSTRELTTATLFNSENIRPVQWALKPCTYSEVTLLCFSCAKKPQWAIAAQYHSENVTEMLTIWQVMNINGCIWWTWFKLTYLTYFYFALSNHCTVSTSRCIEFQTLPLPLSLAPTMKLAKQTKANNSQHFYKTDAPVPILSAQTGIHMNTVCSIYNMQTIWTRFKGPVQHRALKKLF